VIHVGAGERLALDGEEMARDALIAAVGERLSQTPEARVRIKADGSLKAAQAVDLMQRLRGAGVEEVKLLTVREPYR
jgi:biopolymer transport protein ExbD